MTLMIRKAVPKEAALVHEIMVDAFEAYRQATPPSSALSETIDSIGKALREKEEAVLCFKNGTAVGSVRFETKDGLYFRRLAVLRHEQGRGLGRALVGWLEREAVLRGHRQIWLKVRASEPGNIAFYERLGYSISERREEINTNGDAVAIVVMRKPLPSK